MGKVELELVKMVLQRNELDLRLVSQVLEDLKGEMDAAAGEDEKAQQVKKQFVILVSDPKGELEGKDLVGWVLQIPEDGSPFVAEERLVRCAYEFNITPKGSRLPVKTIAEVCEHVSGRITKEQGVWIKTKEPVYVLRTGGRIKMDPLANDYTEREQADGGDAE
jgi:hypothetical protein